MSESPGQTEEFSFTWGALKLLGKSLYSNPWAAISELVANGFDARATKVWVMLDLSRGNGDVTLEVRDNGTGMDRDGIRSYVQVGRNKRDVRDPGSTAHPMGRKGIGKLAALYLSNEFYIETTHAGTTSNWGLKIEDDQKDSSHPRLSLLQERLDRIDKQPAEEGSGTVVQIRHIDLKRTGVAGLDALGVRLANQFLLTSMDGREILFARRNKESDRVEYRPVEKRVAFKNYMMVHSSFDQAAHVPSEISGLRGKKVAVKVGDGEKDVPVSLGRLEDLSSEPISLEGQIVLDEGDAASPRINYSLTGWLGVHATIDDTLAKSNDERFVKNRFYNPSQIRLYVRNKLAAENVLGMLGITQAYANYVEGEISFDVLDEDDLPDVATTNRQGFDENDFRVELLKELLKPLVRGLIRRRESVMSELKEAEEKRKRDIQGRAKAAFVDEVRRELAEAGVRPGQIEDLIIPIENKLVGSGVLAKSQHMLFLSHAGADKPVADFLYYLLLARGVNEFEIFYTSKDRNAESPKDLTQLKDRMRDCITDSKTRIFYLTSPNFGKSVYCLFEGGAGWATRGVSDFDLVTTSFKDVPVFLHNNQPIDGILDSDRRLNLTQTAYFALGTAVNSLISHINSGREVLGIQERVLPLLLSPIPPAHQRPQGADIRSYMDQEFVRLWDTYVSPQTDLFASTN